MKILYFDYVDSLFYEKFGKKFVNDIDDFYDEIINKKYDVLILNFDFLPYFLEIKKFFKGYVIFICDNIDELIYKKSLEYGDYCYTYDETYKIKYRLNYLEKRIFKNKRNIIKFKDYTINLQRKEIYKNLLPFNITPAQKELLFYLLENRQRYISRNEILENCENINSIDSVKVLISDLRKLGFNIVNKKNFGYKIELKEEL